MLNPDGSVLTSVENSMAASDSEETTRLNARFAYNQIRHLSGSHQERIQLRPSCVRRPVDVRPRSRAEPLRGAALAALVSGVSIEIRDMMLRDEARRKRGT
jgi:hypothetical protein